MGVLWDVPSIPLMFAQSSALLLARPKPFFSALLGCEGELAVSQDRFSIPTPRFLTPRSCRADFGVNFLNLVRRNSGKLQANSQQILIANFARECFGLVFQGLRTPPQKFTPRIASILLEFHFLEPNIFSRRFGKPTSLLIFHLNLVVEGKSLVRKPDSP